MSRASLVLWTWCFVAIAASSGCKSGDCGAGTLRYGDECVLVDPFDKTPPVLAVDPPIYTRQVGTVRITSNKPATIYYTIDGNDPTTDSPNAPDQAVIPNVPDDAQLRYFAIDLAGNRSATELRIWIIDRAGPGAPGFQLALSGSDRTVTWTAAPDPRPGGVLVARVDGRYDTSPTSGQRYNLGDLIGPGITIVATSDASVAGGTFAETLPAQPGIVRYIAWGYDSLFNYGPPAGDYALVPIPAQTAQVTVNAGAGTLAVVTPASQLTLGGAATLAGTTLTVKLSVHNDSTRVLFAPKIALTSTLTGVTWTNSDGTLNTKPYRAYGGAIMPGTSANAAWTFTNASSATVLTLDLAIVDGFVLAASGGDSYNPTSAGQIVDFTTGANVLDLALPVTGHGGGARTLGGGITPDGRLVVGSRVAGAVSSFDLASGRRIATATLRPEKSHVPQLILDKSGSAAYAILADNHPERFNSTNNTGGTPSWLVELDVATLAEVGPRIDLGMIRNRSIDIAPDGKTLLVATGLAATGVIVIDLTTFQIQNRLLTGFRPQAALFLADGSIAVVGEQVAIYSAAGELTTTYPTPGAMGKVVRAAFGPPNLLWIGRQQELVNVDLGTGVGKEFTTSSGKMIEVFDGKVYATTSTFPLTIQRLDATGTTVEATLPGFTKLRGHWLGRSPF